MSITNLYASHNLAISIKNRAKTQNVIIKDMLVELELGSNTMSALYHGKSIAFDSLARIADYLDCSVDYLLGRTDDPELHTLKANNKMEIRREAIPYRLAAYGGKNEVVEDDDESKTT